MNNLRASCREAASLAPRMSIVYLAIDQLKPDPANPRRHSKKQIRQIANSIKTFGFNVPVLVDRYYNVIAGHGRLAAAGELGMIEVPTLCLDHLSPAQLRAFMIADNRLTEIASWDDRLRAQQLKDLSLLGLDFSIEVTGFEMGEIDLRIASLEDMPDTDDPADAVPELPARPPLSKVGDLWLLGPHCVLCGNALDSAAYAALLGKERAAMVFTDPPYNVPIDGHASGRGAIHHRPFPMASGEMDKAAFAAFLGQACRNLAAFSTDGSIHFVSMDWRHLGELLAAGRDAYGELINLCVWVKDNGGMMTAPAQPVAQNLADPEYDATPIAPWPEPREWMAEIDGELLGFRRDLHHRFLLGGGAAHAVQIDRACGTAGYAYFSAEGHVGPLAIAPDADAKAVVITALRCALDGGPSRVSMIVPGRADVVMQVVLALGFRIEERYVLMASQPFCNWGNYLPRAPGFL